MKLIIINLTNYISINIQWEKSFTYKEDNAETKLVPNSGKLFLMNTELTQLEPTTETLTFNWKESMSTSMKPLVVDTFPEPSLWIWNLEPWTPLEPDPSVNSSDPITLFSDKLELVITGPKDITLKELNLLTPFSMSAEKKLKDVIACKDSKSPTPSVEVLDLEWEPSLFPKSEKNTPIESWKPSQLSPLPKCLTPLLNHTMPLCLSINWSKTPIWSSSLITKPFTISVSEPLNSPPPLMVILTIWSLLPCLESLHASDSPVNLTLIWENLPSILFLSPDFTSSWLDSPPLPQEDPNNTEPSLSPNLPNKCSMPKTWCALLTPDTEDILPPLPFSEAECPLKKSMNKCLTSKTKTLLTSLNGFPITSNHPFVISPPKD